MFGQKKVTGIISRQTYTFPEVFILQWKLPLRGVFNEGVPQFLSPIDLIH